jgi:hypothetical protein
MKKIVILMTASCFVLLCSLLAFAEDGSSKNPSTGEIVGDVLWIRPLGVIGTALGYTAYVISYPVTAALKKTDEAKEILITDPCNYYLKRPLGEL